MPTNSIDYEDTRRRSRYVMRVSYKGEPNHDLDAALVACTRGGTLCCAQEAMGMRALVFEYTEHYLASADMGRMSHVPGVHSIVTFPRGFACDKCSCSGNDPCNEDAEIMPCSLQPISPDNLDLAER